MILPPGVYGNHGCQSGQMDTAFEYVIDSGGLDSESSYPYEGISKRCRFTKNKIGASMSSYQLVRKGDEADLQVAVAMQGPVAAAVDATHNTFRVCLTHTIHNNYGTLYTDLDIPKDP